MLCLSPPCSYSNTANLPDSIVHIPYQARRIKTDCTPAISKTKATDQENLKRAPRMWIRGYMNIATDEDSVESPLSDISKDTHTRLAIQSTPYKPPSIALAAVSIVSSTAYPMSGSHIIILSPFIASSSFLSSLKSSSLFIHIKPLP